MLAFAMAISVGSAVQLRERGPNILPRAAEMMNPPELGDLLLAPGHPPVIEATIGPQGMEPPPPPNTPIATKITLYLKPALGQEAGFCERTIATVHLRPVDPDPNGTIPSSPAQSLSVQTAYHWMGDGRTSRPCPVERYAFFVPRPGELAETLEVVRLLSSAQRKAARGDRLPFALSVDDVEGPAQLAFDREHPELGPTPRWRVFKHARLALIALPIGSITYVGPSGTVSGSNLSPADLQDRQGKIASGYELFLGGDWTAGVVVRGGRIILIRMRRAVPPPF